MGSAYWPHMLRKGTRMGLYGANLKQVHVIEFCNKYVSLWKRKLRQTNVHALPSAFIFCSLQNRSDVKFSGIHDVDPLEAAIAACPMHAMHGCETVANYYGPIGRPMASLWVPRVGGRVG